MNKTQIQNKKFDILKEIRDKKKKEIDVAKKIEKICFWTWPYGHVWNIIQRSSAGMWTKKVCLVCKKCENNSRGW